MHEELWAGVELKINNAEFFLEEMEKALLPPDRTQMNVAQQTTGAIIDTGWQRSFYAHLDAFLAMARSVPAIIQCCFGWDTSDAMKSWRARLSATEEKRRGEFTKAFEPAYETFRKLPLSSARNISLHRTGVAPVKVNIAGRFGVSYIGTPVSHVPTAEGEEIAAGGDQALQWVATMPPVPVQPVWADCKIDDKSLFTECRAYLDGAKNLLAQARGISQQVHDNESLTPPK